MNRTMTAALSAAAVIGAAVGTTAAVRLVDAPASAPTSSTSPSTAARDDTDQETPQPLLWASGSEIHDGETVVDIEIPRPDSVYRLKEGYLVVSYDDGIEPARRKGTAQVVAPDGTGITTIEFRGVGDVNDDGTEFIGLQRDGSAYGIWDLTSPSVSAEPTQTVTSGLSTDSTRPYGGAALAGDQVLTTWYDGAYSQVVSWRPETDDRVEVAYNAYDWSVSSDGSRFAATTTGEGLGASECLTVGDTLAKSGRLVSCDLIPSYLGPRFSPSGKTMVALDPSSVAGDQPGVAAYEILATAPTGGEPNVVATITPPEGATSATLEDDEHLLVVASAADGGLAIYRCDLTNDCETVEDQTNAESIVLGAT